MKTPECQQITLVEALRDGRLAMVANPLASQPRPTC